LNLRRSWNHKENDSFCFGDSSRRDRNMANFKLSEHGKDISSFVIPQGRSVKLVQWGGDWAGNKLELDLNTSGGIDMTVHSDKLSAASTLFTLVGRISHASGKVSAFVATSGKTQHYSEQLNVTVGGTPQRQPGYTIDLLADLAISGNATDIDMYSKIINGPCDNTHVLSQDTRSGHFNCGDVANSYGPKIFKKPTSISAFVYYKSGTSDKLVDLRFDEKRVEAGIHKIKALLNKGTPVRVYLVHHDGFKFPIANDWRSHFLTIIGYAGNSFLYLDPWPSGSKLRYNGGVFPEMWNCFIGELTWDPSHLDLGIGSPAGAAGLHTYRVIAGP